MCTVICICVLWFVLYILWSVVFVLWSVLCVLWFVLCVLWFVLCILWSVLCILWSLFVYFDFYYVYCDLYYVFCDLYLCTVTCIVSPYIHCCSLSFFVQVYASMPPGANPIPVNICHIVMKYIHVLLCQYIFVTRSLGCKCQSLNSVHGNNRCSFLISI